MLGDRKEHVAFALKALVMPGLFDLLALHLCLACGHSVVYLPLGASAFLSGISCKLRDRYVRCTVISALSQLSSALALSCLRLAAPLVDLRLTTCSCRLHPLF